MPESIFWMKEQSIVCSYLMCGAFLTSPVLTGSNCLLLLVSQWGGPRGPLLAELPGDLGSMRATDSASTNDLESAVEPRVHLTEQAGTAYESFVKTLLRVLRTSGCFSLQKIPVSLKPLCYPEQGTCSSAPHLPRSKGNQAG